MMQTSLLLDDAHTVDSFSLLDDSGLFGQLFPGATLSADFDLPERADPPSSAGDAGGVALRCVDSSHAAGCTRCRPPPSEADESDYQLRAGEVGGAATKDGRPGTSAVKLLRSLLLLTPEWCSLATRTATARAEEAVGDPTGLAVLLLKKQSNTLRKEHLLRLCRAWGYASDLWQLRGDFTRKKRRPPPSRPASPAPVPRPLSSTESFSAPVGGDVSTLRTLWLPSARCFLGGTCREECLRTGIAFFNDVIAAEYAQFDISSRLAAEQIGSLSVSQSRWNAAMSLRIAHERGGDALAERIPALLLASYSPDGALPAEVAVQSFLTAQAQFQAAWRARRASAQSALSLAAPEYCMTAVSEEMETLYACCSRFLTEAQLILLFTRARCSAAEYMAASVAVLHEAALFAADIRTNMGDQREWYAQRIAEGRLRPLPTNVADHGFKEIWGGVAERCEQLQQVGE